MAWRIEFDAGALRDLRGLDRQIARRITSHLRDRLGAADDPRSLGAPLKGESGIGSGSLWRYRVGEWRIVAQIEDEALRILVVRIAHRGQVYRQS